MSVLRKPYEISIWGDKYDTTLQRFVEVKLMVIGSNTMISQSRALQPKLVENVNGTHTFSFMIYYQYKDNITGELVANPYASYLVNERKIKLKYGDQWYDFIIKNIKQDSNKYSYEISATDQYINELSKNGFNLTLDAELDNNVGTAPYLASQILAETDWQVRDDSWTGGGLTSEFIPDRVNETLVELKLNQNINAYRIKDDIPGICPTIESISISSGATIFAFYSCLMDKAKRLSFIYVSDRSILTKDDERVITNKNCQYYIDNVTYNDGTTQTYNLPIPEFCNTTGVVISNDYRGARYVWAPDMRFNQIIGQYVSIYTDGSNNQYYGYLDTEFTAPNMISNWVTNPSAFKSTSGWHTGTLNSTVSSATKGTIINEAINDRTAETLINDLRSGDYVDGDTYTAQLRYTHPSQSNAIVVNSGFYDSRTSIKNILNGEVYICRLKGSYSGTISLRVGTNNGGSYSFTQTLATTSLSSANAYGWKTGTLTITNSTFTENTYKKQATGRVYIVLNGDSDYIITELQIYKRIKAADGHILTLDDPIEEAHIVKTYKLYDKSTIDSLPETSTAKDVNPVYASTDDPRANGYNLPFYCEKRRAITAKESNYFNILQTLCENFECWIEFLVDHNADGTITRKTIRFRNYIGDQNWAGFRYGVNLKTIQRTDDSKAIVTKLIVRQNSNEFGEQGFCTIARAPSSETGEINLYNVDHYINQGLLSAADWNNIIYNTTGASDTNANGYYVRLRAFNSTLQSYAAIIANQSVVLATAKSTLQVAESGLAAAIDAYENATDSFRKLTGGYEWNNYHGGGDAVIGIVEANIGYLTKCAEAHQAKADYTIKYSQASAQYAAIETEYQTLKNAYEAVLTQKTALNTAFYEKFYRFIQEGTWSSEDYYDDEQYYLDAQSVLYTSSVPKVTYSISVLELSQLQGYGDFTFAVGDRTYVEDPEFFGYDENGAPIREQVVLSEITYNLDEPDKNNIKIQNYQTSFQDLFKRITATVQSVSFSSGAYDKAAALADANDTEKSAYLQGALNDASTILQNLADQTVRLDEEGLTIIDKTEPNNQLRAISTGILLTDDGGNVWQTAITPHGINAKILTAGTINTGEVNIMYGEQPTFRWDTYGITAYDFQYPTTPILDKGVRFDRFGVYGFDTVAALTNDLRPTAVVDWQPNGATYGVKPDTTTEVYIRNHSTFELTKEGVYLKLGDGQYKNYRNQSGQYGPLTTPVTHAGTVTLGRVDDLLYTAWNESDNTPYGVVSGQPSGSNLAFVKVFSVKNGNQEALAIYDDGTLWGNNVRLEGKIKATSGEIGGFTINQSSLSAGTGNTQVTISPTSITLGNSFSVTNSGYLTTTSGKIGKFIINDFGLIGTYGSGSNLRYTGIRISPTYATNVAFFAGATSDSGANAPFYVQNNGYLYATNAHIEGYINATSGSFSGELNAATGTFAGELSAATGSFSGTITANAGKIGNVYIGAPSTGGTVGLYNVNDSIANTCGQGTPSSSFYLGTNGLSFDLGSNDSDNFHGYTTIVRPALIMVYGNNANESSQKNRLVLISSQGLSFYKHSSQFRDIANLSNLPASSHLGDIYIDYDNNRMQLQGTWVTSSGTAITSDRNLKHDIEDLDERYDRLFDLLKSNRFKLNDGTSNRYHTGFIAQDVELAMQQAKLDSSEFGALCISTTDYALRYTEFIALNTNQIQKLKSRVAALEARIAQLEAQS